MESPSDRVMSHGDTSDANFSGPPSSPFVSEVDSRSRMESSEWSRADDSTQGQTVDVFMTPARSMASPNKPSLDDKENFAQPNTAQKITLSPRKPSTPEHRSPKRQRSFGSQGIDCDQEMMPPPPPSMRKVRATPRKTAMTTPRVGAATPRENAEDCTTAMSHRDTIFCQRELDMRASQMSGMGSRDVGGLDDTCFSTFSEAPDMTLFAKLNQSATKRNENFQTPRAHRTDATPRTSRKRSSPSRSPSPTPRRMRTPGHANRDSTTTFLIDFTQQMESVGGYRTASPGKISSDPSLLQYINQQRSPAKSNRNSFTTPAKSSSILNLLDFELPPAPTPRSVPTITVRELESLKSSYLSQISSLKATLSGREAEVESLKRAVGDAERRAGEAQEHLREEKCRREQVEEEKAGWERRGQEVENVLKNVKEEVFKSEAERDELIQKLEELERRAEEAESRASRAEDQFAETLAARGNPADGDRGDSEEEVQRLVAGQIDAKIEAVSRELHSVYKEKHERKVATLKKSYEARSEKKCAELQTRVSELERLNEDLQAAKDATFSGPLPDVTASAAEAELKAQIEEQKAHLARLENEMETSRQQQELLMQELKQERIEKGDLVAAVDEMLALQAESGPAQGAMSVVEDFRKSISRPSGLRAPSGLVPPSESRIGKAPVSNLARSVSGSMGKSRMLANIERMGRTATGTTATHDG